MSEGLDAILTRNGKHWLDFAFCSQRNTGFKMRDWI